MQQLNKWWQEKPLTVIMVAGLFFRLLAVLFSKGFGFHDDHFIYVEPAQAWVDHFNYNDWLSKAHTAAADVSNFSFFYTGFQYLVLLLLKTIGITDPQGKMYVIRLIHALYSMLTIYYGYKIAEKLSNTEVAKKVGLLLAILWFWPFMSVRNLVEIACIPPMVIATWLVVKDDKTPLWRYFFVGVLLGVAFNTRYQTVLFSGGFGLALLLQKKWVPAFITAIGAALCIVLIQGGVDYYIKGEPFIQFREYLRYNVQHAHDYVNGPWYNYFLLLGGILIPPISLFILFGFFRNFRKNLILFLPSFVFLAFHSYFPNKQERFIFPIVPFIIILGLIGWYQYMQNAAFWQKRPRLMRAFWISLWVINAAPLVVLSVSYTKRNRVEAMTYLYKKGDVTNLLIDDRQNDNPIMSPMFYLGKWEHDFGLYDHMNIDTMYPKYCHSEPKMQPNYLIMYRPENKEQRLAAIKKYHTLQYETTIEPSLMDRIMFRLNPVNDNQTVYIYKITGNIGPCGDEQKQK